MRVSNVYLKLADYRVMETSDVPVGALAEFLDVFVRRVDLKRFCEDIEGASVVLLMLLLLLLLRMKGSLL